MFRIHWRDVDRIDKTLIFYARWLVDTVKPISKYILHLIKWSELNKLFHPIQLIFPSKLNVNLNYLT